MVSNIVPAFRPGQGRPCAWPVSDGLCWRGAVQAEIAQHSLIVATPPVVEPNVMFTLDDSGSMLFNYLPDTDLPYQIYAIHPREPNKIAYFGIAGLLDSRDGNILSRAGALRT